RRVCFLARRSPPSWSPRSPARTRPCWHVRQCLHARRRGYCEHAQPASPDILDRRDSAPKVDLHLPAEQVSERGPTTTIGHVNDVDTGHHLEQFAGHMGPAASAARRKADLAGIAFGVSDELGNGLGWNRWIDHHDAGHANDACNRRDVADEIEIEFLIESGVN